MQRDVTLLLINALELHLFCIEPSIWENGLEYSAEEVEETVIVQLQIEPVSAGGRGRGDWAFTPSAGGDMEIQTTYLKYNLVTSSVCLRHN